MGASKEEPAALSGENSVPDETGRFVPSGKSDGVSNVVRLDEAVVTGVDGRSKFWVTVGTSAPAPASVGIVFQQMDDEGSLTSWVTAYGYSVPGASVGRGRFLVEAPLAKPYSKTRFLRYAVFSVDAEETHWDNNNGEDFFYLGPRGELLQGFYAAREANGLRLDLATLNLGMERVVVRYSLDGASAMQEVEANYVAGTNSDDHYRILVPLSPGASELSFRISVEVDHGKLRADNHGHGYAIGLSEKPSIARVLVGQQIQVVGNLRRGQYVDFVYNKDPMCRSELGGVVSRMVDAQYRFYDDETFASATMTQTQGGGCHDAWCPSTMQTSRIYIPTNAKHFSFWFHHHGTDPSCSAWDSNDGKDYHLPLE